jgi:hypothetical protein
MRMSKRLVIALALAVVCVWAADPEFAPPRVFGQNEERGPKEKFDEEGSEEADSGEMKPPEGVTPDPAWQIKPDNIPYASAKMAEICKLTAYSPNLIPNASFEEGRYWPYEWEPVDNLCSYWETGDASDGRRFIRMDTLVLESTWLEYNLKVLQIAEELAAKTKGKPQSVPQDPRPKPPPKVYDTAPYYASVGGLHGVHYKGPFFKCQPGAIYRVIVDARADTKGGPGAFVWFKGFIDEHRKMEGGMMTLKRNAWRCQCKLHGLEKNWKRFAWLAHPARSKSTYMNKPVQPEWLQVQLYGYWAPGFYDWDNVRVDIVGQEDIQHTAENQPQPKKLKTSPPKRTEDDFPVF